MSVFGIDLGSTCCRIAKLGMNGVPEIIHNNEDGSDELLSALYFLNSEYIIYGESALDYIEIDGTYVIQDIRSEICNESKNYLIHGKEYTSLELLSLILKKLKDMAEEQGERVNDVVIGVPAYFDFFQKEMFIKAGDMVGLNVIDVIEEPIAVLYDSFYHHLPDNNKNVLVCDLGGKNLDVSLLNISIIEEEEYKRVSCEEPKIVISDNYNIGGKDWDEVLFEFMKAKIQEEFGLTEDDLDTDILYTIRMKAEPSKKKLNILDETRVRIVVEGQIIPIEITRDKFEDLTKSLVDQTMCYIDNTLENAKQLLNDDFHIDEVLLVGGASKMPMIENAIKEKFDNVIIPNDRTHTVAYGAARYGEYINIKYRSFI